MQLMENTTKGYEYRNYEACRDCELKQRCTTSKKGRSIFRHIEQDFLDTKVKGKKKTDICLIPVFFLKMGPWENTNDSLGKNL
jgi:hypothetical protein